MTALVKKIRQGAYWRVNLRPTSYEPNRIATLAECRELVESAKVSLRGWDYPHIDRDELWNGETWIEVACDYQGTFTHIEHWRFYQSGQFIHNFVMREDYEGQVKGKKLLVLNTIFLVTEIFEFAARLTAKGVYSGGLELEIQLKDTENRQLEGHPNFWLSWTYECKIPKMNYRRTIAEDDLLGKVHDLSLEALVWIFERFNWPRIPVDVIRENQSKYLARSHF